MCVCVCDEWDPALIKLGKIDYLYVYNVNALWLTWGSRRNCSHWVFFCIFLQMMAKKINKVMVQHGFSYCLRISVRRRPCIFHWDLKTRHRKGGSGALNLHCKRRHRSCCSCTPFSFRNSTATVQSRAYSFVFFFVFCFCFFLKQHLKHVNNPIAYVQIFYKKISLFPQTKMRATERYRDKHSSPPFSMRLVVPKKKKSAQCPE